MRHPLRTSYYLGTFSESRIVLYSSLFDAAKESGSLSAALLPLLNNFRLRDAVTAVVGAVFSYPTG
jgi:hypothetical protein